MEKNMKSIFRMFKRANRPTFYVENTITGEQKSLGTSDKETAQRLLNAANEARHNPTMNLQMGKVYMTNADPKTATRIWQRPWRMQKPGNERLPNPLIHVSRQQMIRGLCKKLENNSPE
jgi:hypothetical protein